MKRGSRWVELLTLIFMGLAIGAVVCFFTLGRDNPTFMILVGIAIVQRIIQYIMRFF